MRDSEDISGARGLWVVRVFHGLLESGSLACWDWFRIESTQIGLEAALEY